MKKISFFCIFVALVLISAQFPTFAMKTEFSNAIKTCENYTKEGSIKYKNEIFNLLITLQKEKNGKCLYKEKIFQGDQYELLTCNFNEGQLPFMSDSMERFSEHFKKELKQNSIFEAKMTTNGEIFNKYLANPKYCQITHSKR